jgi:hypothetical protein
MHNMKYSILITVAFVMISLTGKAQHKESAFKDKNGFIHMDTTVFNDHCVTVIQRENLPELVVRYIIIDNGDYLYDGPYKPEKERLAKYKSKCVELIKLKPGIKLISLKQILRKYKIPEVDQLLPIFVDKNEITRAETLFAVESHIVSVEVVKNSADNKKLINITTDKEY